MKKLVGKIATTTICVMWFVLSMFEVYRYTLAIAEYNHEYMFIHGLNVIIMTCFVVLLLIFSNMVSSVWKNKRGE